MKIKDVFFEDGFLCITTEEGQTMRQPLEWYPHLLTASDSSRRQYTTSTVGLHWRKLDTDVSFESFSYTKDSNALMYQG